MNFYAIHYNKSMGNFEVFTEIPAAYRHPAN